MSASIERFSCARNALTAGEPCFGTASYIQRWILVEQAGAWGSNAVLGSGLRTPVALELRALARRLHARLLLIRRHGRYIPFGHTCFMAVTTQDHQHIERFDVSDASELLELDWSPMAGGQRVGGRPVTEPLYLVCTNGSHDPCCAEYGRPLAAALDLTHPEQLWEASHFGGDRFAANLVCLPAGIYYGRVKPADGPRLVADHERGDLDLHHFRGRSYYPFVVQAAEHFVREREGLTALNTLTASAFSPAAPDTVRATFATPDGAEFTATVRQATDDTARLLTCRAVREVAPPTYELVAYDVSRPSERV